MPRNRIDPDDRERKIGALRERYQEGQFTEIVFRASLYAVGLRGADIDEIVRDTPPPTKRTQTWP